MKTFEALTDCGVIVNTSFNVRGEPIVCTPEEAYRCFLATGLDVLVLEDFVLEKEQMKEVVTESKREQHLAQFEAD
jgi:carbamoyltransferase